MTATNPDDVKDDAQTVQMPVWDHVSNSTRTMMINAAFIPVSVRDQPGAREWYQAIRLALKAAAPLSPSPAAPVAGDARGRIIYRKHWRIECSDPIAPDSMSWQYVHDGFDGAPDANDFRCGHADSIEGCKADIDEWFYSEHTSDCPMRSDDNLPCVCGYVETVSPDASTIALSPDAWEAALGDDVRNALLDWQRHNPDSEFSWVDLPRMFQRHGLQIVKMKSAPPVSAVTFRSDVENILEDAEYDMNILHEIGELANSVGGSDSKTGLLLIALAGDYETTEGGPRYWQRFCTHAPTPADEAVGDAMVEAANTAFIACPGEGYNRKMRAALTAAMKARGA